MPWPNTFSQSHTANPAMLCNITPCDIYTKQSSKLNVPELIPPASCAEHGPDASLSSHHVLLSLQTDHLKLGSWIDSETPSEYQVSLASQTEPCNDLVNKTKLKLRNITFAPKMTIFITISQTTWRWCKLHQPRIFTHVHTQWKLSLKILYIKIAYLLK